MATNTQTIKLARRRGKENRKKNKNPYHHAIFSSLQRNNIRFRTEYPIHVPDTDFFYLLDFYLFELNIAIELDGMYHQSPKQKYRDLCKDKLCNTLGIKVIRITSSEIEIYLKTKTNYPIDKRL